MPRLLPLLFFLALPASALTLDDFVGVYRGEGAASCEASLNLRRRSRGKSAPAPNRLYWETPAVDSVNENAFVQGSFDLDATTKLEGESIHHVLSTVAGTTRYGWEEKLTLSDGGTRLLWARRDEVKLEGKPATESRRDCRFRRAGAP